MTSSSVRYVNFGKARKGRKPKRDREEKRLLYFAYGSNLHRAQMARRCPSAEVVGAATLRGYRLVFRGVADVEQAGRKATVRGGLWSITPSDLAALDRYEGYPSLYVRHFVEVETDAGPVQALVYRMTEPYTREKGLPSPAYLQTCLDGFAAWGLPHWVMRAALKDAGRWLIDRGVTKLRREGKRMVPVLPMAAEGVFEDDEWQATPGMTPATRMSLGLE